MSEALFIDSGGDLQPVAPGDIPSVTKMGWIPASEKQVADFKAQEKYGSVGQQAITGLEGVGRGLTLGLSTAVERGLGVPAEDIAGREQANPMTSGVSEGVGVALPLVFTMGGAAPVTGPGLAARAGASVTKALIPEAATVAGRILGKAGSAAAGSAVEGAFYGAGHVVHEAALGDPHLTAQSALATIGLSATLLGGAGGVGKLFSGVVKEYTPALLGEKVSGLLERAEAHSNFNATNAMPGSIKKAMRGKGDGATAIGLEARDIGILKHPLADSPDAILDRANEVKVGSGKEMDTIANKASEAGPVATWEQINQDVRQPIANALRSKGSTIGVADQFEGFMDRYAEAHRGNDFDAAGLWKLRQDVGDFIYKNGKVLDPWVKELNTPVKRVYDHIDGLLEKAIPEEMRPAWEAASRRYEVASMFSTLANEGVERSAANNALHLTGTMGAIVGVAAHGPGTGILIGAGSEALRRRGASAIGMGARMLRDALEGGGAEIAGRTAEVVAAERQAGMDTIAQQASGAPEKVAVLAALERNNANVKKQIDAITSALVRGSKAEIANVVSLPTNELRASYNKRVEEIRSLAQDPEQMHNALTAQSADWQEHAPKTAQAMGIASVAGISYLASQIPQPPPQGPLATKWQPSRAAMADFMRKREAIEKPLAVAKRLINGTATTGEIQALAVAHPDILKAAQTSMVEHMAGMKQPVAYQGRIAISRLMGKDMDGSMSPQAIHRASASFASGLQTPPPAPAKAKITLSKRLLTSQQASAERR